MSLLLGCDVGRTLLCVSGGLLLCNCCEERLGSELSHSRSRCVLIGLCLKVLAQCVASCCAIWLGSVANPASPMSKAPIELQFPGVIS